MRTQRCRLPKTAKAQLRIKQKQRLIKGGVFLRRVTGGHSASVLRKASSSACDTLPECAKTGPASKAVRHGSAKHLQKRPIDCDRKAGSCRDLRGVSAPRLHQLRRRHRG